MESRGHLIIYDDSCNDSCKLVPQGARLVAGPHSCNYGGACVRLGGSAELVVRAYSCNAGCYDVKGETVS
jgi:hypothetical protein